MDEINPRAWAAELVGTFLFFALPFVAVQGAGVTSGPPLVIIPFAFGLGLLLAIYAFGHVSGGHFNPAVTIAMVLDGRTKPVDGVGYIVAQIVGAVGAAALLLYLFNTAAVQGVLTKPGNGFTDVNAALYEAILTAGFLLVILASTKKAPQVAGLAIPLTLVAIHFAAVPFTGASVNPARSLGPAIIAGDFSSIWVYLVGPVVGGIVGWAIWRAVTPAEVPAAA
jgi:aquaporin Z